MKIDRTPPYFTGQTIGFWLIFLKLKPIQWQVSVWGWKLRTGHSARIGTDRPNFLGISGILLHNIVEQSMNDMNGESRSTKCFQYLDTFWIFLTLFESFWSFWHIILTLQQCAQAHEAPWVAHDRNSCGQAIQMTWTSSSASAADQWHTAAAWWINIHIRYIYIHTYIRIYIII